MAHNSSAFTSSLVSAVLVLGLASPGAAQAQLTSYNDQASWLAAVTAPTLIGFDDLADGEAVNGAYAGHNFAPFNGGSPAAAAYNFSQAGPNVLALSLPPLTGGGGGVVVDFGAPLQGVGFWYVDSEFAGNSVTVYGAANAELGSFPLAFPAPAAWQFIGFTSVGSGIRRISVSIGAADMVALDSLQVAAVPEPASLAMMLAGLGWVVVAAQRRRTERRGAPARGLAQRCDLPRLP